MRKRDNLCCSPDGLRFKTYKKSKDKAMIFVAEQLLGNLGDKDNIYQKALDIAINETMKEIFKDFESKRITDNDECKKVLKDKIWRTSSFIEHLSYEQQEELEGIIDETFNIGDEKK